MQKIKMLAQKEIYKIAAGQVIDRPANVVKEMIENSIDAGATNISIYIEDGGKELIRVADNGCGMSPEDAKFCIKKHATSKISSLDDLSSINTFGFRGEALASISAVSKTKLTTKETNKNQGVQLELENGTIVSERFVPFTTGTDISVKSLFYNIPVRKKFLKKKETENRHIIQLFHSFCLDYLSIHFKLFLDNRQTSSCPPVKDIISRTSQLWGHGFAKNMISLTTEQLESGTTIYGAISNHQYFRYDRNNIFFFVNKRWIKNFQLSNALLKGYMNVLPKSRYPAAFIFIELDPTQVDINTHPRKEEVKFLNPRKITTPLQAIVKKELENNLSRQLKKEIRFEQPTSVQPEKTFNAFDFNHFLKNNAQQPKSNDIKKTNFDYSSPDLKTTGHSELINKTNAIKPIKNAQKLFPYDTEKMNLTIKSQDLKKEPFAQTIEPKKNNGLHKLSQQEKIKQKEYKIIGQYNKTYILLEKKDGIFFIDQHAAHERILYEIFSKKFESVTTVKLLFPTIISLKKEDMASIEENMTIFKQNGIEIEQFGDNQLIVQSTPVHIKNINIEELIRQVISWTHEHKELDQKKFSKIINEKIHAQMACKAAIKAGDTLTIDQIEKLLNDLEKTPNKLTCPHGRPTGWILDQYDIEKKFKRRL